MKRFHRQFFLGTFALIAATVAALWAHRHFHHELPDYAFLTGWVLFTAMLVLTFFNARKKLPFLSLGKAETWLQIHIYLGFFTVVLFLIHLNFRAPHGWFEITLAWLFALVSASGVVAIQKMRRTLAKKERFSEAMTTRPPGRAPSERWRERSPGHVARGSCGRCQPRW